MEGRIVELVQDGTRWCKRSAVQCSAVQCSAAQCSAAQCSAVQCSAVQRYVTSSAQRSKPSRTIVSNIVCSTVYSDLLGTALKAVAQVLEREDDHVHGSLRRGEQLEDREEDVV